MSATALDVATYHARCRLNADRRAVIRAFVQDGHSEAEAAEVFDALDDVIEARLADYRRHLVATRPAS